MAEGRRPAYPRGGRLAARPRPPVYYAAAAAAAGEQRVATEGGGYCEPGGANGALAPQADGRIIGPSACPPSTLRSLRPRSGSISSKTSGRACVLNQSQFR